MKYGYSQYAISSDFEDIFFLVRSNWTYMLLLIERYFSVFLESKDFI